MNDSLSATSTLPRGGRRVAIMQPYLLPYLGYFQLIAQADEFVVYDDVQFIKGGWINRNRILVNGAPHWFTFAVRRDTSHRALIVERHWADAPGDTEAFLRQLENAYRAAPFFRDTIAILQSALAFRGGDVASSVQHSLRVLADHFGLATPLRSSRELQIAPELNGESRVLAICAHLQATEYLNSPGGTELYSWDEFRRHGIALRFLQPGLPPYAQFGAPFVPALSIVDVMMFNPVERIREMLHQCTLA